MEDCRSFSVYCVSYVSTSSISKFNNVKHELVSEQTITLTIDHVDYTTSSIQTSRFTSSTVEVGCCEESRKEC